MLKLLQSIRHKVIKTQGNSSKKGEERSIAKDPRTSFYFPSDFILVCQQHSRTEVPRNRNERHMIKYLKQRNVSLT